MKHAARIVIATLDTKDVTTATVLSCRNFHPETPILLIGQAHPWMKDLPVDLYYVDCKVTHATALEIGWNNISEDIMISLDSDVLFYGECLHDLINASKSGHIVSAFDRSDIAGLIAEPLGKNIIFHGKTNFLMNDRAPIWCTAWTKM